MATNTVTCGRIIILNGASSSGKTAILQALQRILAEPYLDAGIDKFIWMLPRRFLDVPLWQQVFEYTLSEQSPVEIAAIKPGPVGYHLMNGMHASIAALSRAGDHVLADHVLLDPSWVVDCARLFHGLPAWLVGIRCPLDVLEERERTRRNRTLGQARAQHSLVHVHGIYDIEVDTFLQTPEECAMQIAQHIDIDVAPHAFIELLRKSERAQTGVQIAD